MARLRLRPGGFARDEIHEGTDRIFGAAALGADSNRGALHDREHRQLEDARAVGLCAVRLHPHAATGRLRDPRELRRGPRMNSLDASQDTARATVGRSPAIESAFPGRADEPRPPVSARGSGALDKRTTVDDEPGGPAADALRPRILSQKPIPRSPRRPGSTGRACGRRLTSSAGLPGSGSPACSASTASRVSQPDCLPAMPCSGSRAGPDWRSTASPPACRAATDGTGCSGWSFAPPRTSA